jgi:chemotaxis protein methyltransferase CheR
MYLHGFWKKGTGPIKDYAAVHPSIKSKTKFEVQNLLELNQKPSLQTYDVIFCRNVFIYFSEENVRSIANDLTNRLDARGLFVSGVSEPVRFSGWNYKSVGPSCFATRLQRS